MKSFSNACIHTEEGSTGLIFGWCAIWMSPATLKNHDCSYRVEDTESDKMCIHCDEVGICLHPEAVDECRVMEILHEL